MVEYGENKSNVAVHKRGELYTPSVVRRLGADAFVLVPIQPLVIRRAVLDELAPTANQASKRLRAARCLVRARFAAFCAALDAPFRAAGGWDIV